MSQGNLLKPFRNPLRKSRHPGGRLGNPFEGRLLMSKIRTFLAAASTAAFLSAGLMAVPAQAETTTMVGGAPMYPSKNIIQNAVNSKDHTTLVAAVKAAGLGETLKGPGPFTVFAPTNAAFAKLPAGTVDTLLKPENKAKLTSILTYHVVPGRMTKADLMAKIKMMGGKAELKTVEGGSLWVSSDMGKLWIWDENGGKAQVTISDVTQSNGVIDVVDTVLMPK